MNISIQSKGGTPIYEQIATQIKEAILAGKLNKDDALPSIRALSADIKVSVITTKKAYEELEKEKMIYSVPGKGFFRGQSGYGISRGKTYFKYGGGACRGYRKGKGGRA